MPTIARLLGISFTINIDGLKTTFSATASYSDSYETATDNAPAGFQDDYWLLNAGIRVGTADGQYEVALLGRNLTDEHYMLNSNGWSGSSAADQQIGFFNRPRELILQGTVRF